MVQPNGDHPTMVSAHGEDYGGQTKMVTAYGDNTRIAKCAR